MQKKKKGKRKELRKVHDHFDNDDNQFFDN